MALPSARAAAFLAAFAALVLGCNSKDQAANQEAKRLIWGRDDPPAEVELKAKEALDPTLLDGDAAARGRVIGMRFDEVVARLGFLEYHGLARIEVGRGKQRFTVTEDSVIRQGMHNSFQVVQRDGEGVEIRQGIYNNGVLYLSNSGGKLRVEGLVKDRAFTMREEAWQPLRTFAAYYGPRFGLAQAGTANVDQRATVKYKLVLLEGPEVIPSDSGDTPKKPKSLEGALWVDARTAVPLKGELRGDLETPATEGAEAGLLSVSLEFSLRTVEGAEIKPQKFVPTISRHPTDLEPLAFLDGGTRTSTVIGGGPKHKKAKTSTKP